MNTNAHVHIVDDDESFRAALSCLLQLTGYVPYTYASAGDFLMASRLDAPGCIILDINMPGPSGHVLHEVLGREPYPLPVIFLTGHGDVTGSVRAMKAGAVDFLTKPVSADVLIPAVVNALQRDENQRQVRALQSSVHEHYARLTGREREVLLRVTDGKLNKQIAAELGTSERTIKAHRARVMEKMCANSVPELVRAVDRL